MSRRAVLSVAVVGLLLGLGAVAWQAGRATPLGAAPVPAPPVGPGGSPTPLGPASQALGVNEAVSVPLRREERQGPPPTARLQADAQATAALGATWTRGHTAAWPRLSHDLWLREGGSWARMDAWVTAVQGAGVSIVAMVSPWPANHTRDHTDAYVVADTAAYQAWVGAAVERYDGDGVDDLPGLKAPIHHWEIDNEPDLKNLADLRSQRSDDFATPAQVAQVVRLTAAAIRQADPDAVVLGGGFNRVTTAHGRAYMGALFGEPGVLDALDVVSIHAYHQGPELDDLVATLQHVRAAAPGKPVWVTETSVPASGERPWLSESWQAGVVVATVLECLAWQVEKVFWHTLFDPPPAPQHRAHSGTRTNSLLAREPDGSLRQKPAALAYRALADLLAEVDRADVSILQAWGGRAWRVGSATVVWGDAPVSFFSAATSAHALVGGAPVAITGDGEQRTVDPSGHGFLVVVPD